MIGKLASFSPVSLRATAFRNLAFSILAALLISSCAGQTQTAGAPPALGGRSRTLQDLEGARVAMPIGLLLAGMDTNRDWRLSRSEVLEGAAESFKASDKDSDAFLSPIEFLDWQRNYLGYEYATPGRLQFDLSQDARISALEFTTVFEGIHQRLDVDQNGRLARAELLVEINGLGIDPAAIRAQIENEVRQKAEGRIRELCRRGGRR